MKDIRSIEVVWNQSKQMVLAMIETTGMSMQLEMTKDNANDLAILLQNVARIPERARAMSEPQQPETLADIIRREAHAHNEAVYTGAEQPTKWHPDQAGNGVAAQGYAE